MNAGSLSHGGWGGRSVAFATTAFQSRSLSFERRKVLKMLLVRTSVKRSRGCTNASTWIATNAVGASNHNHGERAGSKLSSWRTSTTMSTGPSTNFSRDARRGLAPFQDGTIADGDEATLSASEGCALRVVFCFFRGGIP